MESKLKKEGIEVGGRCTELAVPLKSRGKTKAQRGEEGVEAGVRLGAQISDYWGGAVLGGSHGNGWLKLRKKSVKTGSQGQGSRGALFES